MAVTLSVLAGAGAQFLDNNGDPLSGGLLYTYAAGTSTPAASYTDSGGGTPHANPIVLDSGGRPSSGGSPAEIWVTDTVSYKFVLKTSVGVTVWSADNITGAVSAQTYTAFIALLASSAGAAQVGFIQSGTGAATRTVQAKLRETISAADYALFADACAESVAQDIPLLINVDRSLAAHLTTSASMIAGGGAITLGAYNLTINGMVTGGPQQIFNAVSSGVVVLSGAKTLTGHAEWWGCVADSSTGSIPAANTAAINAALVALLEVQLMSADYYTNGTVIHRTPNHILRGASGIWDSTYGANGTRIVNMGADETILTMGDAAFSALNTLPLNLRMSDIEFMRAVAPTYNGDSTSVEFQYASNSIIERCRFSDSLKSLEIIGTVYCKVIDSHAKRTAAATGGTDSWRGFYCNGTVDIGSAGGNASLYLVRCNASDTRASVVDGRGFVVDGKFSDVFWTECETVTCSVGMDVVGNGATTNDYGNQDVMISHSINDSFVTYGIRVASLGYSASVEITSPYCGPAAGASSALHITGGPGGAVIVNGGQLTLGVASSCEGIRIPSGGGVQVLGTVINESAAAAVIMDAASNCRIEPIIINKVVTGAEGVYLYNVCAANYIAPIILGKTTGRSYGIRVNGTADVRNEYNCTGIDSGAVNGGAGQKMVRNNVSITAAYTLTGTNTTSGVMT